MSPDDRKYTEEHEWVMIDDSDDGTAVAGITEYAQDQLGDIVFFELPKIGDSVAHLGKMGEVESVKAVSELFCPVTGKIIAVNADLNDHPELVNSTPHETWMLRLSLADPSQVDSLLDAASYGSSID